MKDELKKVKKEILNHLKKVTDLNSLSNLETKYLGRKGEFTKTLRGIKDLRKEAKKEFGQLANSIKKELDNNFNEARAVLEGRNDNDTFIDVTLPGERIEKGSLNPITLIQNELEDLFTSLGFVVLDGPELESDYYCFEALNIPANHPARDMQDTFYIDKKNKEDEYDMVMRTHTSPVQVRAMQKYGAPLRAVIPGRCFRSEATDVRHEHTLYHFEGIMIDESISFSHMKGILTTIGKKLYGEDTELRMRPKFYPFVEPGSNGEFTCFLCKGKGCRLCKGSGWLEILGCGMIHPKVLEYGGIDSKKYSGFAFGLGLSRLAQLKFGIEDTRLFMSGDLRFLKQF